MASSNVLTITETNFDSEIIHSTVPVLVDFWAPWCGPCKMLSPVIDEIADARVGQVKVAKVNVDDAQALAARYRINSIPALLFFKNGEPVEQLVGAVSKSVLTAKLDSLL
jgi:thioredoxin 1